MDKLRKEFEANNPPPEGIEWWSDEVGKYVACGDWARGIGKLNAGKILGDYNDKWQAAIRDYGEGK